MSSQGVLKLAHGPNAIFTAAIGKGNVLATGGGDNNLKLWQILGDGGGTGGGAGGPPKMPLAPLATLSSHSGDVVSCAFRPNSKCVPAQNRAFSALIPCASSAHDLSRAGVALPCPRRERITGAWRLAPARGRRRGVRRVGGGGGGAAWWRAGRRTGTSGCGTARPRTACRP